LELEGLQAVSVAVLSSPTIRESASRRRSTWAAARAVGPDLAHERKRVDVRNLRCFGQHGSSGCDRIPVS